MSKEKDILNKLKKQQKPEVPEGFFENFADELLAKIAEEESGLNQLKKANKPEVPDGFFEGFSDGIYQETNTENNKGTVISLKVVGYITAIAACLLIAFLIIPLNQNENNITKETNNVADSSKELMSNDELLAMMDEDDIVNFLIDNEDISLESSGQNQNENYLDDEDVYYYLEEDIEELYIEDL